MIRLSFALIAVAVQAGSVAPEHVKQTTFFSPQQAAEALFAAVQGGDDKALALLFGGNTEILSSRDQLRDSLDRKTFVVKYREMHRIGREDGGAVLYVGAENWPFPVPLAFREGSWFFDTEGGEREIAFRRIGENELSTIDLCRSLGSSQDHQQVLGNTVPVYGYLFRKLQAAGKDASFLAYPAEYGSSGIMTFVVGPQGTVYERDLGARTALIASTLKRAAIDGSWHALQ
jgi:Protein of unknown function (DUF2950)